MLSNDNEQLKSVLLKLRKRIENTRSRLAINEAATRTSLVNPFLDGLGYDARDPEEVVPEYRADIGSKRGEKVDYAVIIDHAPVILIEAKKLGANLADEEAAQLRRYFHVTEATIGILTDGQIYRFYLDIDKRNVMDDAPYLIFDICEFGDNELVELVKYSKSQMAQTLQVILEDARRLKHKNDIKQILASEIDEPSEKFVEFFARQLFPRARLSQPKLEQTAKSITVAGKEFINEKVVERLAVAMKSAGQSNESNIVATQPQTTEPVSTEEEHEAFRIIKAIVAEDDCQERVHFRAFARDSRCLWDDSRNNKIVTVCIRGKWNSIHIYDTDEGSVFEIDSPNDLYKYKNKIRAATKRFSD